MSCDVGRLVHIGNRYYTNLPTSQDIMRGCWRDVGQAGSRLAACPAVGYPAVRCTPRQRVHDIKVETLARCGAGWQPARRLATAAVRCQRGIWPIDNRPQLAKLLG